MSVYNRKMFKRNARNALNQSAGIAPVQKFQVGGQVQTRITPINVGANRSLSQPVRSGGGASSRTSVPAYSTFTSPITGRTFRSRTPSGRGITSLQPFDIARRYIEGGRTVGYGDDAAISPGEYALLQASQSATVAGDVIQDPTDTRAGGIVAGISRPFVQAGSGGVGFIRGLTEQALQGALSSPDGAGTDTLGQRVAGMVPGALDDSYLASLGINEIDPTAYSSPIGPQPAPVKIPPGGMAADRIKSEPPLDMSDPAVRARIAEEQQARAVTQRDGVYISDEETGAFPPSTATLEDALNNQLNQREAEMRAAEAAEAGADPLVETQATDPNDDEADDATTETPPGGTDASGDPSETGTTGTLPSTKEEIEKVINQGNEADQKAALDGFIKEFMDKAPGYEGADSGLVLAKIGFAMAAGKSPRAIENIASALEGGADMLIKDKSKKDEFNRQLKLSALQYGLTETSKMRAEDRRISAELGKEGRALNYFVADGDVTVGDRTYKKGETVPVTTEYIRENGLPSNLTTVELAKAAITANGAYQKALAAAAEKKMIDPKAYGAITKDLNEATTDFVSAHQLRQVVQRNLITNAEGNITGVGPAFQQLVNRAFNSVGVDAGQDYENVDQFNQDMRRVSNSLLKDLLGEGSKNVSNIDRKLADEIVGLYAGYGGYIFQDPDLLNQRLQNVLATLERKERNALNVFQGAIDSTEGMTFRSGKDVSLNIPESARAALQGQGSTALSFQQGDDGVFRRV